MRQIIKAFNIDYNWNYLEDAASPGLYAHANAFEQIRWFADLGVNTIQSFCVAFNGYAWYPSGIVPMQPGLSETYLEDLVALGHERSMQVMGYFCMAANPRWYLLNPGLFHRNIPEPFRIPFTNAYLDEFCASVRDALLRTNVDGFMIDWFNVPVRNTWLDCEKQMYRELMGETFPVSAPPAAEEILEFDRRVLARAWRRVKETVDATRPALIWTNHPFTKPNDPRWNDHQLLREVDWVLNEDPDLTMLEWLAQQVGPHTRILQNLCGWKTHDASVWRDIDLNRFDLYGFAQADPATCMPSVDPHYDRAEVLQRNITLMREAYHLIKDPDAVAV